MTNDHSHLFGPGADAAPTDPDLADLRFRAVLDSIADGVVCIDRAGDVTYLNAAAGALTGWTQDMAVNRPLASILRLVDRETRKLVRRPVSAAPGPNGPPALENGLLLRRNGGETAVEYTVAPIRDLSGREAGTVIVLRDVGAAIETSRLMAHLAQHDVVTGLPNRLVLHDRLAAAMAMAHRRRTRLAVGFLDLDGFKQINDSLGHATADRLLQSVATRLRSALRRSDTVCRYGGDEFVIMLPEIDHAFDVAGLGVKILLSMAPPHRIDEAEITLTASLGVAIYPEHGRTADVLIANADAAMYTAKRAGPGRWSLFEQRA